MRGEEADALRSHTGTCLFWDFVFHSVFSAICILMTLSAVTADSAGLWGHNHCRVQVPSWCPISSQHRKPWLLIPCQQWALNSDRKTCLKLCQASVLSSVKLRTLITGPVCFLSDQIFKIILLYSFIWNLLYSISPLGH